MTKLLQVPDGLKRKALKLADELGDVIIDCESCYGACDLAVSEAKALGCDGIVHLGHSKMIESEMPVEYREVRESRIELPKTIDIKEKSIGLVASIQFVDSLDEIRKLLERSGKTVKIGNGNFHPGQILGCDFSSAKEIENEVDAFLYVGTGHFHPLGLALQTGKPVYSMNLERNEVEEISKMKEKFLKQRYAAQALAKDAKLFGILVSIKPGQLKLELAKKIKSKLEADGKKAYILSFNEIKPEKLLGIEVDCYINTACPRIAIENRTEF
ncbi:MAG: diphthamide biosynthesis enzyme Dph2, partial [Candidatus Aenigmatarchaeota archaeon]